MTSEELGEGGGWISVDELVAVAVADKHGAETADGEGCSVGLADVLADVLAHVLSDVVVGTDQRGPSVFSGWDSAG